MPKEQYNHLLLKKILENLPIGVELYNKEGELIEVNHIQMERIGIKKKKDIMGIKLFDNPNIPQEVKYSLLAGEDINCIINFNRDLTQDNFPTELPHTKYFKITASILYDDHGGVNNYMLTTDDITEHVLLNEELYHSKLKINMITRSFEAMPWEFDTTTNLFTCEGIFIKKFNWHSPFTLQDCLSTVHPKHKYLLIEVGNMMLQGKELPPIKEVRMRFPNQNNWQFCTIKILPCKRSLDGKVIKYIGFIKISLTFEKRRC